MITKRKGGAGNIRTTWLWEKIFERNQKYVEKGGRGPGMHKCLQRVQKVKLLTSLPIKSIILPIKSIILSMKSIIFSIMISIIYVYA